MTNEITVTTYNPESFAPEPKPDQLPVDGSKREPVGINTDDASLKDILHQPSDNSRCQHPRWLGLDIPFPYKVVKEGLLKTSAEKVNGERIAGPIFVVALTIGLDGTNGGLHVEFEDVNKHPRQWTFPRTLVHDEKSLAKALASMNFFILPGREKDLATYIALSNPPQIRTSTTHPGWVHKPDADLMVFQWPDKATSDGYHYQPERPDSTLSQRMKVSGSLSDWTSKVFSTKPFRLFAVLSALSGTLIKFLPAVENGGFHFYGPSSGGKTTLLQTACSVFGGGGESKSESSYMLSWNTTRTALEINLAERCDLPLCLDELGKNTNSDVQSLIYDIASGQGKSAGNADRTLRQSRTWRSVILSSGELSLREKIEQESGGKNAKAGLGLRVIDLRVGKSDAFGSSEEVDRLKTDCSRYFGTLGRAFVEYLILTFTSEETLTSSANSQFTAELNRIVLHYPHSDNLQKRALKRFALSGVAGYFLVHSNLIPELTKEDVQYAIDFVVSRFMESAGDLSDAQRGLISLRNFIQKYRESRFTPLGLSTVRHISDLDDEASQVKDGSYVRPTIYGYFKRNEGIFYLYPAAFAEAINGAPEEDTARLLKERGFLKHDANSLKTRVTVEGERFPVYAVKAKFLQE